MKHTIDNYTFSILRKRVKTLENIGVSETIKLKDVGTSGAPTIVNQTGEEIKTLYEAELNAYTDIKNTAFLTGLTKLTGIEAGADVTDIVNVNAAGAVMKLNYNANTLLYAVDDNTPVVKTRAEVMGLLSGQAAADFAMNTHKITGVVDPTADQEAATKKYVDDNIGDGGGLQYVYDASNYSGTDTQKIQAAIDAAEAVKGEAYVPAGTWTVTGLTITEGIVFSGVGPGTVIQSATAGTHIIDISSGGNHTFDDRVIIRNMSLDFTVTPNSGTSAIFVSGNTDTGTDYNAFSKFINLKITNASVGIHFLRAGLWHLVDCNFHGQKLYGIWIENQCNSDNGDQTMRGCRFWGAVNSTADIYYESGGGFKMVGNKIYGDADYSLYMHGEEHGGSGGLNSWVITGNSFEGTANTKYNILIEKVDSIVNTGVITGNEIIHGIHLNGVSAADVCQIVISGNLMNASSTNATATAAIEISNAGYITISGNKFAPAGTMTKGVNINASSNNIFVAPSNQFSGFSGTNEVVGTSLMPECFNEGIKIQGINPGFWLDETGTGKKGAYCVLDELLFQIQRRAQNFGNYEASPFQLNITSGNSTFSGTVTATGINAAPSSGNATINIKGAAATNYGILRLKSNNIERAAFSANNSATYLLYSNDLNFSRTGGGVGAILKVNGDLQLDGVVSENAWTLDKKVTDRKWELIDSMLDAYKEHDGRYLDSALRVKSGNKWGKRPSDFIQVAIECIAELRDRIKVLENKK